MNITEYLDICSGKEHCRDLGKVSAMSSPLAVFKYMCSPDGRDYLMQSVRAGWGPSGKDLADAFGRMMNGGKTARDRAKGEAVTYHSGADYVDCADMEENVRRVVCLVDCYALVRVPKGKSVSVYMCGESTVKFTGGGMAIVFKYGGTISAQGDCSIHCINVKER